MKILSHSIIFSGENIPELSSCAFPSLCKLKNGTVLASFKGGKTKGPYNNSDFGMTCFSTDNGKTWSNPVALFTPPVVDGKATTIRTCYFVEVEQGNLLAVVNAVDATMPDLTYYNEQTEGLKDTYILVAHSKDDGKTWGELSRVQVQTFYDMPLPLTGAPFVTKDGRVGIQFEVNKPYYEVKYWVHHSCAVFSSDGGYTWGDEVVITDNPDVYYWDQRIDVLDNGDVADIFWTFDRRVGDYVNIHFCLSKDGGRTFSELIDTGLVGQPGNVVSGKDGEMIAIYINRTSAPVIRLAKSYDEGKTWEDCLTVFDYGANTKGKQNSSMNDVWSEMAAFSIGHPYIEKINGELWAYFYCGPSTHRTDFHLVKIEL